MSSYLSSNSLKTSSSSFSALSLIALLPYLCLSLLCINNNIGGVCSELLPDLKPAEIGGCYDVVDNMLVYCAALEDECLGINATNRVRFKAAKEIESLLPAQNWCTSDTLPVGTCKSTGQCALTMHACDDQNELEYRPHYHNLYEGTTTLCNAHGRFVDGRYQPTQYGACMNPKSGDVTCVLSPNDCTIHERWLSANEAIKHKKNGCRCHDIRIGACQPSGSADFDSSSATCAISSGDCLILEKFQSARVVMDKMSFLDCRLCPYDTLLVTTPVAEIHSGNYQDYQGHGGRIFVVMFAIAFSVISFCVIVNYYDDIPYRKDAANLPTIEITSSSNIVANTSPAGNNSSGSRTLSKEIDGSTNDADPYEEAFADVNISNDLPKIT